MAMELMVKAMKLKVGNPLRKLVLIKLADNANDMGECWPSYQHIADQCEISRRAVINHINALEEAGLLVKKTRPNKEKGNSSNVYFLRLDGAGDSPGVVQEIHQGSEPDAPGGGEPDAPRTSHSFEPVNEPVKKADRKTSRRNLSAAMMERFERFYSAYPRKQNRAAAERAFKKLNPDDELLEIMITAVENQKKSESWSNGYVPHPSTWINGRRWEDEIQVEYTGEQKEVIDCYNDAVGDELGFIDPDIFSEARAVRINTFMGLSEKPKFWQVYFEYVRDNCSMPPSVGFDYLISPDGFNKIKGGQHERKQ